MGMVSMKMDDDEAQMPSMGLCLCLSEDQVAALGLDKNPPAPGSKIGLRAIATVRRVTQEADDDGADADVSLMLEITDMEVAQQTTGAKLYGGDND